MFKPWTALVSFSILLPSTSAAVAAPSGERPCATSVAKAAKSAARFTSEQMKDRAVKKVELGGLSRTADIKGTVLLDVFVTEAGDVDCIEFLLGHPLLRADVGAAIKHWTFKPLNINGRRVSYRGRLEFTLCNILCGDRGTSMTLLK